MPRQSNIELCRIVSILLVVIVHSNFSWLGWPTDLATCSISRLFVESLSIIGVNVFVIITGYFSANIKTKTFVNLFYICFFYAIVKLLVGAFTNHLVMQDIFFISNSNWFIPAYIGLILLTPWLNSIDLKRNHIWVILGLFLFEIWFGYFPAVSMVIPGTIGYGYSIFSFVVLYVAARYLNKYGFPKTIQQYSLIIYIICSIVVTIEAYLLVQLCEGKEKNVPTILNHLAYSYNNPIVILSSFSFFISFAKVKMNHSKMINHVAQSAIAVLLVHTSLALNWPMKLYFNEVIKSDNSIIIIFLWILGIFVIYALSALVDQFRIYSYKYIGPKIINAIDIHVNKNYNYYGL